MEIRYQRPKNNPGQECETKLLTTIYLRALACEQITQFHLAYNVAGIGDLADVCMRFKTVNDVNADYVLFIQPKYKEDVESSKIGLEDLWRASGDYSLLKHFNNYRKIRNKFNSSSDVLCRGNFDEVKPYYVMHTTLIDDIESSRKITVADDVITNLLRAGENSNIFQLAHEEQDVDKLTSEMMIENIKNLKKNIFQLIRGTNWRSMMIDEHIRNYHVVLAQKVFHVTDIETGGCRVGTFRKEFFYSTEKLLVDLRKALYAEAIKNKSPSTTEINDSIEKIITKPSAENISELIGNVLEYDSKTSTLKLSTEVKHSNGNCQNVHKLSAVQIPKRVANEAFEIAGRKILQSLAFKLPEAFGNIDMTINKKKTEKRIQYLADQLFHLIDEAADTEGNVVLREGMYAADKSLNSGFLAINGGLAGAVGNLLVPDGNNKLKFNMNYDPLPENARKLFDELEERLGDLQSYRFIIEIDNFPRFSLEATEYEKRLARDFFKNLYFFTGQAKELEDIISQAISKPNQLKCIIS